MNNVDKQLAETVSFKRNVIGSFIENVDAEFNAKKNMNKSKQDILDTLKVLCEQLGEHGSFVETQAGLEGDAKNEACAIAIMENGGLASSSSDNNYDVSTKDCANVNSSRGYYASIFCALDGVKAQKLTEARKLYEGIMSRYSDAEKDNVKERIVEIENYIGAFEEDAEEVSVISPGATRESTKEAVRTANANRKTSIKTDEAAITAMDNQSRSTAYCPVY